MNERYQLHPGLNYFIARVPPKIWWIGVAAFSAQRARESAVKYFHQNGVEVSVQEIEVAHLYGGLIGEDGAPIALPPETPKSSGEPLSGV